MDIIIEIVENVLIIGGFAYLIGYMVYVVGTVLYDDIKRKKKK